MAFNIFKKKKAFDFPEKGDIEAPPVPPSLTEEPELPEFPSMEAEEVKVEAKPEAPKEEKAPEPSVEEVEDKAVKAVEKDLEEAHEAKPLFIEAKLYKGVLDEIGQIKNSLKDNEGILDKLADFKDDSEKNYNAWHKQVEDIQKKLIFVDRTLFNK